MTQATAEKALVILGTGSIAHRHAEVFAQIPGITLAAAIDSNLERARAFADLHGAAKIFGSLQECLDWGGFHAAVNSTPDNVHYPTTMQLLEAGKAVFCEKPLAVNYPDALKMTEAAERTGLVNMVNLTYRNAYAIQTARRMVEAGEIGEIRHLDASYLQSWLTGRHWGNWRTDERWLWRLSTAHGSKGVLGDIGIHILDFVTYGTGLDVAALNARLKTFGKAEGGAVGGYTLDANDSVAMTVEMSNGALGVVHMSRYATGNANELNLTIYGERGALRIWANQYTSRLEVCAGDNIEKQIWTLVDCPETPRNEQRFALALFSGINGEPDFRRAADIQKLLDLCFVSDAEGRTLPVV